MRKLNVCLLVVFLVVTSGVAADVQVTTFDNEAGQSVIKMNKNWATITYVAEPDNYMLVDMKNNTSYLIDRRNRLTVKLDSTANIMPPGMSNSQAEQPEPKVDIVNAGKGLKIAGYQTTRYILKANDQLCSEHFISSKPLALAEVKTFSATMSKQADVDMGFAVAPCSFAERELDRRVLQYGVPLLSRDQAGNDIFKITEIKANMAFPKAELDFPPGYQHASQKELMAQELKRALGNM